MAEIASTVERRSPKERSILLACVGNERHELGARMAADLFSWDGWKVYFLGADLPEAEVAAEARRRQVEVVGLSATMLPTPATIRAQVAGLREAGASLVILGGEAFRTLDQAAVTALGADGICHDARAGVDLTNRLFSQRTQRRDRPAA